MFYGNERQKDGELGHFRFLDSELSLPTVPLLILSFGKKQASQLETRQNSSNDGDWLDDHHLEIGGLNGICTADDLVSSWFR